MDDVSRLNFTQKKRAFVPKVLGRQLAKIVRIVSSLILDPTSNITASTISLMKSRSTTGGLASGTSDCPIFTPTVLSFDSNDTFNVKKNRRISSNFIPVTVSFLSVWSQNLDFIAGVDEAFDEVIRSRNEIEIRIQLAHILECYADDVCNYYEQLRSARCHNIDNILVCNKLQ